MPKALTSDARPDLGGEPWYLFGHCTEVDRATGGDKAVGRYFAHFGAEAGKASALGVAGWLAPMVMK
ncbi:hypothetical protein LN650_13175 [Klebsiella pneumoniae subsp. pneumoniae]|nr:hypothetical protein [Klebsiella pneumoniae subsp. pneumoniae]